MVGKNSQEFRDRVPLRESPDRLRLKEEERKGRGRRLTSGVRLTVRGKERRMLGWLAMASGPVARALGRRRRVGREGERKGEWRAGPDC